MPIDLDSPTADTRWQPQRDRWGRPLIIPPDGGKPRGYTRATTVAKTLDDEGSLTKWAQRMTAAGLVRRPDLLALVAAKLGPTGDIPQAAKDEVQKLCDQAKEAAAASAAANMGTALHALTELVDLGAPLGTVPDAIAADLEAYRRATERIEWLGVEQFVVLDDHEVAGTFDRLGRLPDGRLVIADLKTGADLAYSWRSIAVQLAIYAHGVLYADGARTPLPDGLDVTTAVVIHLPVGRAECTLHAVDIAAGWDAFAHSMWARRWRARRDLASPLVLPPSPTGTPAPITPPEAPTTPVETANRHDVADRLRRDLAALDERAAAMMRARLAADGLPRLADCTPDQLAAVERHLADVLRDTGKPFHDSEVPATVPASAPRAAQEPRNAWQRPDDGGRLDEATEGAFVRSMKNLPPDVAAWCETRLGESVRSGRPIKLPAGRTVRLMEVCRAMIACAALEDDSGELVRHLLAAVLGSEMPLMPACSLGQAFGSLTIDEARRLERAASAAVDGAAVLAFDDDGRPVLATAA